MLFIQNISFSLQVSLHWQSSNISKLLLLNSSSGCLSIDSNKINYLNQPKCITLKNEENSYTLSIIFIKQPDCLSNNETPDESWKIVLIIVGSIVGLALIFILIVLIVPSFRSKIFGKKLM